MFFTHGWVHVIAGCMFCGKTDEMLRLLRRFSIAGRQVVLVKPRLDTRTDEVTVVSRSGAQHRAVTVDRSAEIEDAVGMADIVAIEEGQFFDEGLPDVVEALAATGKQVIVTGLDRDFRGVPFGTMPRLLALADQVTKLTAICMVCGEPATRTQRLIDGEPAPADSPLIVIGGLGDETYEARCRLHHEVPSAPRGGALAGTESARPLPG
jgi:thymidine kinase